LVSTTPVSPFSPLLTKLAVHVELRICIRILEEKNRNGASRFIGGKKMMIHEKPAVENLVKLSL
jgi:hypothetical protein